MIYYLSSIEYMIYLVYIDILSINLPPAGPSPMTSTRAAWARTCLRAVLDSAGWNIILSQTVNHSSIKICETL